MTVITTIKLDYFILPVKPRATRIASMVASVPELTIRIIQIMEMLF